MVVDGLGNLWKIADECIKKEILLGSFCCLMFGHIRIPPLAYLHVFAFMPGYNSLLHSVTPFGYILKPKDVGDGDVGDSMEAKGLCSAEVFRCDMGVFQN